MNEKTNIKTVDDEIPLDISQQEKEYLDEEYNNKPKDYVAKISHASEVKMEQLFTDSVCSFLD